MATGKYTKEREIGRGGMGTVWLGHDNVLGRAVAMKRVGMVPGGAAPDLERAEREARLAASLNHPHVVAVFDLFAEGDEHWLVMEYVEGQSLAEKIRRDGALTQDDAASVLMQVADALAAAHAGGIVHRDIKPSNIMLTTNAQAKLTDFGIARAQADASLTQTGLVTGSPAYLAPEVASGSSATAASDVWALGATLFHALAGRAPYDVGDNVLGALYQIVHEAPPRLQDAGWLSPLLEHTMATEPNQRWTAAQVRDYLRDGAAAVPPPASPPVRRRTAPSGPSTQSEHTTAFAPLPPGSRNRTAPGVWMAVIVATLALVVGGVWLALHDGNQERDRLAANDRPSEAPSASDPPPTPEPDPEPSTPQAPDPAAMEAFVSGYLDTVTSDPKATWAQLTPEFQDESGNFGRYKGFWRTIADVTVLEMSADPQQSTVTYTVRYDLSAGGQATDTVTLRLEQDDNGFQVAGES